MKIASKTLLIIGAFLTLSLQADAQKFGYINSQLLLSEMPSIKEANSEIETLKNQLQKKGQDMLAVLQGEYQALQKKEADGSIAPKELETEAARLQEEQKKIAEFEQTGQERIYKKTEELFGPIQQQVKKAIDDVAAEQGYTYILDTSTGSILYADPSTDITALVKAKLGL